MKGPCLCGDPLCPSCGRAMGYDPEFDSVCDWLYEVVLADMPTVVNREWLAEDLANRLFSADTSHEDKLWDAILATAKTYHCKKEK